MSTPTPPLMPEPGTVLGGKYRVERVLGEGGMGIVFEALHLKLGQKVAIKMLLPALLEVPELVGRFEREARASGQLRHRNTARVIDVDVTATGVPYIVMELLHGHDLESELTARGALPIGEAVGWVTQACAAMTEAHRLGIVHRDLKPSNLFLNDEADGSVCLKVLDFGISKVQTDDAGITSTQAQMGTPLYMSPEQVRSAKNVDHRTDVWSIGIILYELLAGRTPYIGSAAGIGAAIVHDPIPPLKSFRADVPDALVHVIEKALAKNLADRWSSMPELAAALAPFSSMPVPIDSMPRVSLPRAVMVSAPSIAEAETLAAPSGARSRTGGSWAVPNQPKRSRVALALGLAAGASVVVVAGVLAITRPWAQPAAAGSGSASVTRPADPSPIFSSATLVAPATASTAPTASASAAAAASATTKPAQNVPPPATRPLPSSHIGTTPTGAASVKNPDRL